MKRFLIIFFLLIGCSTNQNKVNNNLVDFSYDEDLSFEEFKIKLEVYAVNNQYTNIDD